jgi:hypothetical protein
VGCYNLPITEEEILFAMLDLRNQCRFICDLFPNVDVRNDWLQSSNLKNGGRICMCSAKNVESLRCEIL